MSDEPPVDEDQVPPEMIGSVLVFRNKEGQPVAVPDDVVTAAERAYRCYKSNLSGKSWDQIAVEEQYPSASAAKYDVDRYLEEGKALVTSQSMRDMLNLEVARIDALQAAIWPNAMSGHVPSAVFVLNCIMNRAKLTIDPEKLNSDGEQARTVVVPSTSSGYVAALQKAAGQDTPGSD